MYKKGDYVIKIPEDICEIEDVGCLDMSGVNKDKDLVMKLNCNRMILV